MTVMIVDGHYLVREGIKQCLRAIAQNVTMLEAETLESAVRTWRACPDIDLVVLDSELPDIQGVRALDDFRQTCPGARVVITSAKCDMPTVQAVLARGGVGILPKHANRTAFTNAIRFVLEGGVYIPPEALMAGSGEPAPVFGQLASRQFPARPPSNTAAALREAKLTSRQIDVLAQLLEGKPNKQICRELNLALGTVKCHVGAILGALDVSSSAEAIAAADKRGWREWLAQPRTRNRHAA